MASTKINIDTCSNNNNNNKNNNAVNNKTNYAINKLDDVDDEEESTALSIISSTTSKKNIASTSSSSSYGSRDLNSEDSQEKGSTITNKIESIDENDDDDAASLVSNYSNQSTVLSSGLSIVSNEIEPALKKKIKTNNNTLLAASNKTITNLQQNADNNSIDYDESIIIPDDDEHDNMPLSKMISSYNKSNKSKNVNKSKDILDETISNVVAGSTPTSSTFKEYLIKTIKLKKKSLLKPGKITKKSKLKQSIANYDKKLIATLENNKNLIKKKRYRRTKLEMMQQRASADSSINASVLKNVPKTSKLPSEKDVEIVNKIPGKRGRPAKIKLDENLIPQNKNSHKKLLKISQKYKSLGTQKDLHKKLALKKSLGKNNSSLSKIADINDSDEVDQTLNKSIKSHLKRQCIVCKRKVHQDMLNEHYLEHFESSPKCITCDKVSKNPTNYVTHLLSHLPSQFFCVKCKKWFRQPIVFRRHREGCLYHDDDINVDDDDDQVVEKNSIKQNNKLPIVVTNSKQNIKADAAKIEEKPKNLVPRRGRPPKIKESDEKIVKTENHESDSKKPNYNLKSTKLKKFKYSHLKKKQLDFRQLKQNLRKKAYKNYNEENDDIEEYDYYTNDATTTKIKQEKEEKQPKTNIIPNGVVLNKRKRDLSKNFIVNKLNFNLRRDSPLNSKKIKVEIDEKITEDEEEKEEEIDIKNEIQTNDGLANHNEIEEEKPSKKDINFNSKNANPAFNSLTSNCLINPQELNDSMLKSLKTAKDLSSCGTYKVKIQRRHSSVSSTSNSSFKQQKENDFLNGSVSQATISNTNENNGILKEHRKNPSFSELLLQTASSPQKLLFSSSLATLSEQSKTTNTPSKLSIQMTSPSLNIAPTSSVTSAMSTSLANLNTSMSSSSFSFECPECEKKFVSYYGLVQHYDQHPNLKVTCMLCEITFENHHSLVLHNTNVHHLVENNSDKVKENLISSNQLLSKKTNENNTASNKTNSNQIGKPSVKSQLQFKSKSHLDETDYVVFNPSSVNMSTNNTIPSNISNDLSSLPSIMTRTSRLTAPNLAGNANKQSILGSSSATSISKPSLITSAAILNHTLTVKTSGFADLSFIDFSCINFPRIAQNYCELWPRKLQLNQLNSLVLPSISSSFTLSSTSSPFHSQQQQHQLLQPLHNYMCDKCGFYFPCKASLQLHKIKKSFATSKLIIKETTLNNLDYFKNEETSIKASFKSRSNSTPVSTMLQNNKITSQCQLFMTNSKYLDYEKTLDEIITKIEIADKLESVQDELIEKTEYLKIFGLVNVSSLTTIKTTNQVIKLADSNLLDVSKVQNKLSNLEPFTNPKQPKTINLAEKLLIKLRKQMLNINHQFIIDLNRWKYLHSNESNFTSTIHQQQSQAYDMSQYSNKIHLKPHVNLNRPLLIRSKKLKRNATKILLQSITTKPPFNSSTLTSVASLQKNNNKQSFNASVSINNLSVLKTSSSPNKNETTLNKNSKSKSIVPTLTKTVFSNTQTTTSATFSKPFFNATSGNFSAALNLNSANANKNNIISNNINNKISNSSMNKRKPDESTEQKNKKSTQPTQLSEVKLIKRKLNDENEEDLSLNDIEEESSNSQKSSQKTKRTKHQLKRLQHSANTDLNHKNHQFSNALPPPPPLLPINKVANTSANSSRLASASGMMPPKLPKLEPFIPKLPKLLPKDTLTPTYEILTSELKHQATTLMPKLKPQQNIINNNNNNNSKYKQSIPPPPQLELFGYKSSKNSIPNNLAQTNSNGSESSSASSSSVMSNSSVANESQQQQKNKKSENMSLKCKFCRTSFKGQSEFLQHVLVKHNQLVKQKLNKAKGNSNNGFNTTNGNRLDLSSSSTNSSSSLINATANSQSSMS